MANTPKIRFKGFTDDWEQRKLGEISNKVTKKNQDAVVDEVFTNSAEFGIISQRDFFEKDIANAENIDGYYVVESDDFVYNPRISTTAPFGPIKRNKLERTGAMSPLYYVFRPYDIDLSYLEWYFQTTCWHAFMRFNGNSGARSDRFAITDKIFNEMPISMPQDIEEQKLIGTFLTKLESLITLHQRKCDETKELKKFMLQKMFPKNGEKKPEIRFNGFTDDWEQRKFSDVVDIGSGMDYKHLGEGDIPVYGTGGYMLSVDAALSEDKDAIGIGRKGTIDKPYILRAPFWTVDTLFYCIPKDGYDLDFTSCLFQNVDWKKKDESTGVPSLSKVIINNVETAAPSYEEQRKIGDYFKGIDNLITLHQRKCDNLKEVKKYMLQNMFPQKG